MNDLISRQDAIDDLHGRDPSQIWDTADIEVWINALPSVQPDVPDTNVGELISKQDAIGAICSVCGNDCDKSKFLYDAPQDEQIIICPEHYVLTQLPSAQKTGEWIDYSDEGYVECPFCHSATNCDGNKDELHYCFSCGAELR